MLKQLHKILRRQKYLDELLSTEGNFFPYIKSLRYVSSSFPKYLNENKNKVYASVYFNNLDCPSKKKSEVSITPEVFKGLNEYELKIVLCHENEHCKDYFDGMILNGELFDVCKLRNHVFDSILELRAVYAEQDKMYSIFKKQRETVFKNISYEFIVESENSYVISYLKLKNLVKMGQLFDYEKMTVEKHLLHFNALMKTEKIVSENLKI